MSTSASATTAQTATETDAIEAALRQAAQAVDEGREIDSSMLPKIGDDAGDSADSADQPTDSTPSEDADDVQQTETGKKPLPAEKKPEPDPTKEHPEDKGKTPFQKAKAEAERRNRSWKKFQQEQEQWKAEVAKREEELVERERKLTDGQPKTAPAATEPLKDELGYTANAYRTAAAKWEATGDYDMAKQAIARAEALDAKAKAQPSTTAPATSGTKPEEDPSSPQFRQAWEGNLNTLIKTEEFKDLGNKDSALYQATATLLKAEPRFSLFPDGIKFAAEYARMQLARSKNAELTQQLATANKELEKLRKATSPSGGGSESRGKPKTFEEMSEAEQEAHLQRLAAEQDA